MGDLKTQNTSYPAQLDTATTIADYTDEIVAAIVNGPNSAIVALENELGVSLKGTAASLAARLNILLSASGGVHVSATEPTDPLSTEAHFYYNSTNDSLYVYNLSTGAYDVVSTAAVLSSYIRKDTPTTITAIHTFQTGTGNAPFVVTAGSGVATGLDADTVDGQHRGLTIDTDHTHTATGAMGGQIDHTLALTNIGTYSHTAIDTFIGTMNTFVATKAQASGLASLDAGARLVQSANTVWDGSGDRSASATPAASTIPVSGGDNRLAWGWRPAFRGCKAQYNSAFFSVASGTSATAYQMAGESYDTDNIHDNSTNNTRFTIPAGVSKVRFTYTVDWSSILISEVSSYLRKNGGGTYYGLDERPTMAGGGCSYSVDTGVMSVTPGDYYELMLWHNYSSAQNVFGTNNTTSLCMEIVE